MLPVCHLALLFTWLPFSTISQERYMIESFTFISSNIFLQLGVFSFKSDFVRFRFWNWMEIPQRDVLLAIRNMESWCPVSQLFTVVFSPTSTWFCCLRKLLWLLRKRPNLPISLNYIVKGALCNWLCLDFIAVLDFSNLSFDFSNLSSQFNCIFHRLTVSYQGTWFFPFIIQWLQFFASSLSRIYNFCSFS